MNSTVEPQKPDHQGRTVLIVDDDRLNLRILSRIPKPEGLRVEEARSGEDALTHYFITAKAESANGVEGLAAGSLDHDGLKKDLLGLITIEKTEANSSFKWAS